MLIILKLGFKRLKENALLLLIMTGMTLALTFAFSGMAGDSTYQLGLIIVDESQSEYSQELVNQIHTLDQYAIEILNYEESVDSLSNGNHIGAVHIKREFGDSLFIEEGSVEIIALKQDVEVNILSNNIAGIISRMNQKNEIAQLGISYLAHAPFINTDIAKEDMLTSYDNHWNNRKPISVRTTSLGSANSKDDNLKAQIIGFAVLFSAYTMVFGVGQILSDKEEKTYHRMMVSPLNRLLIMIGYTITPMVSGMTQLIIVFLGGKYLFGLSWNIPIVDLLLMLFVFVFTLTAFGLLLSTFVKSSSQLGAFTPIILTSFGMLGGCMWPLEIVSSKILLMIANFIPHKWAVEGLTNITVRGGDIMSSLPQITALLIMGILAYGFGLYRLRTSQIVE